MPSVLKPISSKIDSRNNDHRAIELLAAVLALGEWLFSYWESMSLNDSSGAAADSAVGLDSGTLKLDMMKSGRG